MKTASSILLRVLIGVLALTGIYIFLLFAIAFAILHVLTTSILQIKHTIPGAHILFPKLITNELSHVPHKRNYT